MWFSQLVSLYNLDLNVNKQMCAKQIVVKYIRNRGLSNTLFFNFTYKQKTAHLLKKTKPSKIRQKLSSEIHKFTRLSLSVGKNCHLCSVHFSLGTSVMNMHIVLPRLVVMIDLKYTNGSLYLCCNQVVSEAETESGTDSVAATNLTLPTDKETTFTYSVECGACSRQSPWPIGSGSMLPR